MKGQAISLDWIVAISLFASAMLVAAFSTLDLRPDLLETEERLGEFADSRVSGIRSDLSRPVRSTRLVAVGNYTGRVPVDTGYIYPESTEGATLDVPGEPLPSVDRLIAAPKDGGSLYVFLENVTGVNRSSDLEVGSWINGSNFSALPGSPGLESLRFDGTELLNSSADLPSSDYSTFDGGVYATSLDSEFRAYTNVSEFILEDVSGSSFSFRNFTTLYWKADNSTSELVGQGTFESGETTGLALVDLQSEHVAVTFAGLDNATVSKPDNHTVEVEPRGDRVRLRLEQGGETEARARINFSERGGYVPGSSRSMEPVYGPELDNLSALTDSEFERRYDLDDEGFNVTLAGYGWGSDIPLETVVSRERSVPVLERKGEISREQLRVSVWE